MLFFDMYIFGIKTVRGKLTGMIVIKYNLTDRQTDRQTDKVCLVSVKFFTIYTKKVLPDSGNLIQAILPLCFF